MRLRQDHRRAVPAETPRSMMGAGIPLTDEDRYPWLGNLRDWMTQQAQNGANHTIVTCSALKRGYRDILRGAEGKAAFIGRGYSADR